jgi:hypothetical protein
MTDRDRFELDMSPGMQPPSGFGDRVLVGLALVVLVVGAFIAVGKMLPNPDDVAQASAEPSARPTRTPRPSPTPRPPRVATIQDPDIEFSIEPQPTGFNGWVRALTDVTVRFEADPEAGEAGVLKEGEMTYASEEDRQPDPTGWLYIQNPSGWIATYSRGIEQVRRYEYPRYRGSGDITSLIAGPGGFVAMVRPPGGPDTDPPGTTAISAEGGSWQTAEPSLFDSWNGGSIAWGPAGWLAATYVTDQGRGRIWLWSSADGLVWTRLGMLGGIDSEFVTQLLGSESGYLLETFSEQGGYAPNGGTIWSSTDGQTWVESTDPIVTHEISGERRIAALQGGFYLWETGDDPGRGAAAFSSDGQTWSQLDHGPDGIGLRLVSFRDGMVAIDLDRVSLAPRVWSAIVDPGQVSWVRESAADAAFAGGVVRQLVSDGSRVYAFGWDLSTEQPLVWSGDGSHWTRSVLPESFGGIPTIAAAGPAGVVVVGHRHTLRGDNPIFWHRTPTGRWVPEADPILEAVPDPAIDCPPLPSDFLEFVVADAPAMVSCHGAAAFTFRAFSVRCDDCYGLMSGHPEPQWLVNPTTNQLFLGPSEHGLDWYVTAVLAPSLAPDPAWTGSWIEITGHYDDPAAAGCHQDVDADSVEWWGGRAWTIDQCRETFVVSRIQVVDGP